MTIVYIFEEIFNIPGVLLS